MRRVARLMAVIGVSTLLPTSMAAAPSFFGIPAVTFPGDSSQAFGVSADGTRVVGSTPALGGGGNAYVWDSIHGTQLLGDLPDGSEASAARAISSDGSTVVGTGRSTQYQEAFVWNAAGGMKGLGGSFSTALGVSGSGAVVVGKSDFNGFKGGFIWDAQNGMRGLGRLPGSSSSESEARGVSVDGKVVVGYAVSAQADFGEAFLWTAETGMQPLGDLPGLGFKSAANAISADGSTIVGFGVSSLGAEATLWGPDHVPHGLGDLPGGAYESEARAVSANGSVIVGRATVIDTSVLPQLSGPASKSEAFIWDAEHGMRSLKDVLVGLGINLSDWDLYDATGVSADGSTIVGWGFQGGNPSSLVGFVAVIPEPGTTVLIAFGLGVLGVRRYR